MNIMIQNMGSYKKIRRERESYARQLNPFNLHRQNKWRQTVSTTYNHADSTRRVWPVMASEDFSEEFCTYRRETTLEIYNTSINKYPQAKLSCTFSTQLISLAVKYNLQQDMTFLFVSYVYWYVHSLPTQPPLIANFSTNILPVLSN